MANNEGPVIIDGHFEPVQESKPIATPQYDDRTMEAAFVKAGFPPLPEQQTTPVVANQPVTESQPVQNVSTPTTETPVEKVTPPVVENPKGESKFKDKYIDPSFEASRVQAMKDAMSASAERIKQKASTFQTAPNTESTDEMINRMQNESEEMKAKIKKQVDEADNKIIEHDKKMTGSSRKGRASGNPPSTPPITNNPEGPNKEKSKEAEEFNPTAEDLNYVLSNPEVKKLMEEILKQKREEDKKYQYQDEKGNLVKIPLPIKEEMDLSFDKDMRVADIERAGSYGSMENELYNMRIDKRKKELKELGYSDAQIDAYMEIGRHDIKLEIQQYVKGTVTRDFRRRVIDRIENDTNKYKDYIDPKTGEVIESIKDENLIGRILDQKVYPKWQQGELDAMKKTEVKEPDPTPKKTRRWGLIGGVIGFTAAVAGGASVGIPVTIGATVLSIGAAVAEKYAPKRIAKLTERLANAKTPEERENLEKRIKAWNFVNKHAHNTVKFFKGMAVGGGLGTFVSNMFMGGKGLVEIVGNNLEAGKGVFGTGQPASNVENTPLTEPQGEGVTEAGVEPDTNPDLGIDSGNTAGVDTGNVNTTTIEADATFGIDTSNGILVKGGRVELPGSAWDGNLATKPLGNLSNGALNSSNYTGGATNMGAFNLESALQSNGVTETLLRNNLQTPEIHRLLNIFVSNPSTDLSTALQSLNSEGAKTILEAISN